MNSNSTPNYKALCAELADRLDDALTYTVQSDTERSMRQLIALARTALAQPEPQGPTDEEIYKLALDGDFLVDVGDGFSCMVQDEVEFARAVLARWGRPAIETVGEGPSDEELCKFFRANDDLMRHCEAGTDWDEPLMMEYEFPAVARAVLARWGSPAIEPVAVSDPPAPEDCDAEGRCWLHQPHPATPEAPEWKLMSAKYASILYGTTHRLPHWALPVPAPANTINQNNY